MQTQPLVLSLDKTYAVDELAPFLAEFKANLDRHRRVSDSGAGLKRKRDAETQEDADVACAPKSLLRHAKVRKKPEAAPEPPLTSKNPYLPPPSVLRLQMGAAPGRAAASKVRVQLRRNDGGRLRVPPAPREGPR